MDATFPTSSCKRTGFEQSTVKWRVLVFVCVERFRDVPVSPAARRL